MENIDKKKLANEKRLKAIKERQRNRIQVQQKITVQVPDISFSIPEKQNNVPYSDSVNINKPEKNQLKLFDSDDEDFSGCFKIRPQFEGIHGQRMLELSSGLSDRFKLDERFQEKELEFKEEEEDPEKNKNIRILESILGHEVSKKHPVDVSSRKKRELKRFNPEDENAVNYIKAGDKVQKKRRKKEQKNVENPCNEEIPYSSERYIEVASDLKNIITSASPFSFSEQFNASDEIKDITCDVYGGIESKYSSSLLESESLHPTTNDLKINKERRNIQKNDFECHSSLKDSFFISSTDERMKDGIHFFMRSKSLDEIREEWKMKRDEVLEIFKRRKKSAQRGSVKRHKKQSQKKSFQFK